MVEEIPLPDSVRDEMERIYTEMSPADIPWNIESPPGQLVDLVASGQVQPCRTIDVGCGAGNQAIYLASRGYAVTGVDVSAGRRIKSPGINSLACSGFNDNPHGYGYRTNGHCRINCCHRDGLRRLSFNGASIPVGQLE